MSRSRRLHNITFGGWLVVAILSIAPVLAQQDGPKPDTVVNEGQGVAGETPTPNDDSGKSANGEQTPTAEPPLQAVPVQDKTSTERPCDARCQAAEKREDADLVAQQRMAESTEDVVGISKGQLAVGGIGITLLVVTVFLTIRATNAAVEANRIARESSERQLRAYVFVLDSRRTRRGSSDPWIIETHIQNSGQTPAYKVRISAEKRFVDASVMDDFEFSEPELSPVEFDLPPGQQHTHQYGIPELSGELWDEFKGGKIVLLFWGRVDFVDAFGSPRWARFRFFQDGSYVLNLMNSPRGNDTSESQDN